jgi:hypothetical protein
MLGDAVVLQQVASRTGQAATQGKDQRPTRNPSSLHRYHHYREERAVKRANPTAGVISWLVSIALLFQSGLAFSDEKPFRMSPPPAHHSPARPDNGDGALPAPPPFDVGAQPNSVPIAPESDVLILGRTPAADPGWSSRRWASVVFLGVALTGAVGAHYLNEWNAERKLVLDGYREFEWGHLPNSYDQDVLVKEADELSDSIDATDRATSVMTVGAVVSAVVSGYLFATDPGPPLFLTVAAGQAGLGGTF